MRAIQIERPKRLKHIEIAEPPAPGPGEAIVRTHCMGVCGTDISSFLGKFPFFDYPRIPGHELGVEVVAVGAGVAHVNPGDRCSVEPYMHCGSCYACRAGRINCCQQLEVIGIMRDGGLCDRFAVRADKLHVSKTLSYEQLALVETLAIGCHASARCGATSTDQVLIIGAGPIGLSTLEFVRLTGASIAVMDMSAEKLDFCRRNYGIQHTVQFSGDGGEVARLQQITGGDGFSIVIDATGSPASMAAAINHLAHTGTLLFVGVTRETVPIEHPLMHRREATLKSTRNALPDEFARVIQLMETGEIDTAPWITHRTTFDRVVDEFASFTLPESGVLKAVVEL